MRPARAEVLAYQVFFVLMTLQEGPDFGLYQVPPPTVTHRLTAALLLRERCNDTHTVRAMPLPMRTVMLLLSTMPTPTTARRYLFRAGMVNFNCVTGVPCCLQPFCPCLCCPCCLGDAFLNTQTGFTVTHVRAPSCDISLACSCPWHTTEHQMSPLGSMTPSSASSRRSQSPSLCH